MNYKTILSDYVDPCGCPNYNPINLGNSGTFICDNCGDNVKSSLAVRKVFEIPRGFISAFNKLNASIKKVQIEIINKHDAPVIYDEVCREYFYFDSENKRIWLGKINNTGLPKARKDGTIIIRKVKDHYDSIFLKTLQDRKNSLKSELAELKHHKMDKRYLDNDKINELSIRIEELNFVEKKMKDLQY